MSRNLLSVRHQIVIVRQFKNIGITNKLQAYFLPTSEPLTTRFYNGRIAYQYKNLRVGLNTLRKQPPCHITLIIEEPALPF